MVKTKNKQRKNAIVWKIEAITAQDWNKDVIILKKIRIKTSKELDELTVKVVVGEYLGMSNDVY